jgi:HD-like signal output (HDOD) protein
LKTAIAQTQLMKQLLSNNKTAQLVGSVGTLPSFPKAFQEISACLREPRATVADAARIINRDMAMTANVMKLVNSAFFGARRHISSVDRAVAFLGFDTLSALALGHGLFQSGPNATEALWQHSLNTAMMSRVIALKEHLPVLRIEEAFLAGMLHDIGHLLFAVPGDSAVGDDAPSQVQTHHDEAGGYLLGLWAFPSHIVSAVAQHHSPHLRADTGLDLTVLVHIADRLVQWRGEGSPSAEALGIEAGLLESLGLSDHLPQWMAAAGALNVAQEAS